MPISRKRIESRLQPWLPTKLPEQVLDDLVPEDFLDNFNQVANDLNEKAFINVERYYKKTGTDNSEDSLATNYLAQGVILNVLSFKYESSEWKSQYYGFNGDRFFLKVAPDDGIQMDMWYLRQCEDIDVLTDEIDLPEAVYHDYFELLKFKILSDYGLGNVRPYEEMLSYYGAKVLQKIPQVALQNEGVRRSWFELNNDDTIYEIGDQWLSLDNWTVDANGDYFHVDGSS